MAIIAVSIGLLWVVSAPRSLEKLTPYIEKEINSKSSKYKVDIGGTFIRWSGFKRAFTIDLKNIDLLNKTNDRVANFPKASFDFSIFRFLRGRILSSDVTLHEPVFHIPIADLLPKKEAEYDEEAQKNIQYQAVFKRIYKFFDDENLNLPINSLVIKNAEIVIDNGSSEFVWQVKNSRIRVDKLGKENRLISEASIALGSVEMNFHTDASMDDDKMLDLKLGFEGLPSNIATDIFPDVEILRNINILSDGSFNLLVDKSGDVSQAIFSLKNISGAFNLPRFFPQPIKFNEAHIRGSVYDSFSSVAIDEIMLVLGDATISASGIIKKNTEYPSLEADVKIANLATDDLQKYWPIKLGVKSRDWVVANITKGMIKQANGQFNFTQKDMESLAKWSKNKIYNIPPPLSENAIKSSIDIENANVHYNKNLPDIENAWANVKISAKSLDVTGSKAKSLGAELTNISVSIPDFWQRPLRLEVGGDFIGKNKDAVEFLKRTVKNIEQNDAMESIYNSTGDVSGNIMLEIPIKKALTYNEMDLRIDADFKNAVFKSFFNGNDFKNSNMSVKLNNFDLHIEGNTKSQGRKFDVVFDKNFSRKSKYKARYTLKGNVDSNVLKRMKIADIPYASGDFYINSTITEYAKYKNISGRIDLKNTFVNIDKIGFAKGKGAAGKVVFKAVQKEGEPLNVEEFTVKGAEFSAEGNMRISSAGGLEELNLSRAKFSKNDLSLKYSENAKSIKIETSGKGLDLSEVAFSDILKKNSEVKKTLSVQGKFDTLYMKNSEEFSDVSVDVDCSYAECVSVNLYGKIRGDKFIAASLKPLGDRSSLRIESDDAGVVINSLGITKHVKGGALTLNSTFAKKEGKTIAQGVVEIRDFVAVKTPTLGKLLTLASLKGITDILNNKGISFKKFSAPFTLSDGVIKVSGAKSSGSSIGITAEGDIDTNKSEINLKGAIVPAQAVNKILGQIPVVGTLLTGGKNEGIIATKYKIKGSYADAKVTVNPFTILTPGFLRNIFDILPDR